MNTNIDIAPRNGNLPVNKTGVFTSQYTKQIEQLDRDDTLRLDLQGHDKKSIARERQRLKFSCKSLEKNLDRVFSIRAENNIITVRRHL